MIIEIIFGFMFGIVFCGWARNRVRQFDEMMKAFEPKPQAPKDEDLEYLGNHIPNLLKRQAE